VKASRTLWVPPGYKSFFCFLFVGNRLYSASLTFPEFQRADSNICLSGEGGDGEVKENQFRNKSAALGLVTVELEILIRESIWHLCVTETNL